jgi:hypothetical protein
MAVISFGDSRNQVWGGAGWALRQALKDLRPYAEGNEPFLGALDQAEHMGHLGVDLLDPALRRAVVTAIAQMCTDIISGVRRSSVEESLPGDRAAHERYHEAIKELLLMSTAAQRGIGC